MKFTILLQVLDLAQGKLFGAICRFVLQIFNDKLIGA